MASEVYTQTRYALRAADEVERTLAQEDVDGLWYAMQAFLVASTLVSRLLFSRHPPSQARRRVLRRVLRVDDADPVLQQREARDIFEHFDQRFEEWAVDTGGRSIIDRNVGVWRIGGIEPTTCLRNFDHATWTLTFRGRQFALGPLIAALRALEPRARAVHHSHPHGPDQ